MARRASIWAKLALAIATPLAFYSLSELVLWMSGVRPLSLTEDPYVGFASSQPLFVRGTGDSAGLMVTNPAKLTHFNPQSFPVSKPAGAYRIFTVGGSACYGHPWRDRVSFGGWLRELLPAADSGRKWEVVNCGGISYASYRAANVVAELARYRPDLIIVYSGHNEFLEERTYRGTKGMPRIVRELDALLEHTRTYSALRRLTRPRAAAASGEAGGPAAKHPESGRDGAADGEGPRASGAFQMAGEVDDILARTIGPTSYTRNDTLRRDVLGHYRASLGRMAELAHAAGAEILFVTTPANEKDCSPFKSEPGPGIAAGTAVRIADLRRRAAEAPAEAAALLDTAVALDGRDAGLLYAAGKASHAAGDPVRAKALLRRSIDEDICPLRALTPMREIVLETARAHHAPSLDFIGILESKVRSRTGDDLLGEPEFVDHVHLSIDDYRYLALAVLGKLGELGIVKAAPGWNESAFAGNPAVDAVTARVMAGMGPRELGEGLHNLAKVINWAGKHDDAARIAERALAVDTTGLEAIWSSLFVGAAREREGRETDALPHYRRAVRLDTTNPLSHHYLADALRRMGDFPAAAGEYAAVVRLDPGDAEARGHLGILLTLTGRPAEAIPHLRAALNRFPGQAELAGALAEAELASGNAEAAEAGFRSALARNPRDIQAIMGLGRIAESRGNLPEAINLYSQALSIDPGRSEARSALGRILGGMPTSP